MPREVLGPEWGPLAGQPAEAAARQLAAYAADLEERMARQRNSQQDDDDETDDSSDPGLDIAKQFKQRTMQPVATEFVGNREAARSKARQVIASQGLDWNQYGDYVDQAMANATPQQQVDFNAWAEAWWYVWGTAQRASYLQGRTGNEAATNAERNEAAPNTPPRSETRTETSNVSADRGGRSTRAQPRQWQIPDDERETKRKFEKHLGIKISDEEWVRLQTDEGADVINTYEGYQALQERMARGR